MKHGIFHLTLLAAILPLMATGCSELSRPDSMEPTLILAEATDVARTEATLTAEIRHHGGPALMDVRLHCQRLSSDPEESHVVMADPSLTAFEFRLSRLYPGETYSCRLTAETATASLSSNQITFTTLPNDPPTVSAITTLSTGPLGIIVRFSITDDGGDPILEAGCEVKEVGSSESRRIYTSIPTPLPGHMQLSITGLTPASSYTITPFASNVRGETRGEAMEYTTTGSVVLTEPGILAQLFGTGANDDFGILTIAGPMNGDDFRTLRGMLRAEGESYNGISVADIDLSDASIVEGGGSYDGQHFTTADRISTGMFAGCLMLRSAILPNSATAVERNAFARCSTLEMVTLPVGAESVLPSSDCPRLHTIGVSPANTSYTSLDGVLLSSDEARIVWFPCGKPGEYTLPPTITAIGESAFAETSITSLLIPSAVTAISRGAFAGSALREIRMPDNLTNISEGTFQNCTTLTTVRLGASTEFIGDYAFDGTDLTDLYVAAEYPPYANMEAFTNRLRPMTEECTLHVPAGTRKLYRSNAKWGKFNKIEEFQP